MDPIFVGTSDQGQQVRLLPEFANRHGLVAGATGTGKTVTLMTLAEGFSRIGVPVFMADVKGDVAGLAVPGTMSERVQAATMSSMSSSAASLSVRPSGSRLPILTSAAR